MFRFDHILVSPTRAVLQQTLRDATTAADSPGQGELLRWPLPSLDDFFDHLLDEPDGWWQWNGGEETPSPSARPTRRAERGRGHRREPREVRNLHRRPTHQRRNRERRSVVAVVWWSDCIGRRHVRVIGCQRKAIEPPERLLEPTSTRCAFAHVYAERVFQVTRDGEMRTLVACPCGIFGTAEEIGWMGESCGPCHDRREEGVVLPARTASELRAGTTSVLAVRFSGEASVIATFSRDRMIRVWDVATGQLQMEVRGQERDWCLDLRVNHEGTAVAMLTDPRTITVWDVESQHSYRITTERETRAIEYRGDELVPIYERLPQLVYVPFESMPEHDWERSVLAVSPDRQTFALAIRESYDLEAYAAIWSPADVTCRAVAKGWRPSEVQFSPDGATLLTVSNPSGGVQAWDVATGAKRGVLQDRSKGITSVAMSQDGELLATGDVEGRVKVYPTTALLA
jgi:hypothetical protein